MSQDSDRQKDKENQRPVVGVIDVRSPKNKNGIPWAIVSHSADKMGNNLDAFVCKFAHLATGHPALLGFEAPLFVPFGRELANINKARDNEGCRAWSASAGATVTATALAVVPYVLQKLREQLFRKTITLDWKQPLDAGLCLVFEAFVSGKDKVPPGHGKNDACPVAEKVAEAYPDLDSLNCIRDEQVFSLAGADLLRTGWTSDLSVLAMPCMVVKP